MLSTNNYQLVDPLLKIRKSTLAKLPEDPCQLFFITADEVITFGLLLKEGHEPKFLFCQFVILFKKLHKSF